MEHGTGFHIGTIFWLQSFANYIREIKQPLLMWDMSTLCLQVNTTYEFKEQNLKTLRIPPDLEKNLKYYQT